ncbi:MAG: hypothetical protein H7A49_06785 [Akkermansiaceae bacterium]|nr:hypothetical protein [Akkermansiaceae bacterium]
MEVSRQPTPSNAGDMEQGRWRSCTPETLEELRGGLQDEAFSREALIGYNTQLMQSDPEAAVRATVKALESRIQSPSGYESIKLLFWEDLPPELDFAKLEALLPTDATPPESGPDLDPIANGRRALF